MLHPLVKLARVHSGSTRSTTTGRWVPADRSTDPGRLVDRSFEFSWLAARGLVRLPLDDVGGDALSLPLCLSLWLRRSGADLAGALHGLLGLRSTLLEVSGLDAASEPVPLTGGDERRSLLNLSIYLHHLIGRAAAAAGIDPVDLVDSAVGRPDRLSLARL